MKNSLSMVSLCLVVLASTFGPGRTQDLFECACSVPVGTAGMVSEAQGKVYLSRPAGMTPALAGARFDLPANLMVGPKSASTVVLGKDCRISIAAGQSLVMQGGSNRWCAFVIGCGAADGPVSGPTAGAAFAITVGAVIATRRNNDRVSR